MTPADLRAIRERLSMTQAQLADALRMGKQAGRTVRGWEIGERRVPGPVQVAIELMVEEIESCALRESMADKLTRVANALKGEPPPNTLHSWHDLPEVAAESAAMARGISLR